MQKFNIYLKHNSPTNLKQIKELTSLPMAHINESFLGITPLLSFANYEESESLCFGAEKTNDFEYFVSVVETLISLGVEIVLEGASDLSDMRKRYVLSKKILVSVDMLDALHERFPTSQSWEEEVGEEQKFFVEIEGKTVDAKTALVRTDQKEK
jgi:hypothetical protein